MGPDGPDESFLADIGRALRWHLRRKGLWEQPPEFLGYPEFQTWNEAFAPGLAKASPTLDCYEEAIALRYVSLMNQLNFGGKHDIDGLVHLNVQWFVLKRQRKFDPVGYAVFKNLEKVLNELIDAQVLRRVPPKLKKKDQLRNHVVLIFNSQQDTSPAPWEQIKTVLKTREEWERAMPRLSSLGIRAQRLLHKCVSILPECGITAFLLGDFVGLLKDLVGDAHPTGNGPPVEPSIDPQFGKFIRTIGPDSSYEAIENRDVLVACIRDGIGKATFQERKRSGILLLWEALVQLADTEESIPTLDEMARLLGTPKATVWEHWKCIQDVVRDCQKEMNR
jgi:hypothetical protein